MALHNYQQEISKLFAAWRNSISEETVFISDGVTDPAEWFSQPVRPLFLLKEAYGGKKDWNLIDYILSDGKATRIWRRISLWTKGIFCTSCDSVDAFHPYAEDIQSFGNVWLHKIAVVNIKKYNGEKQSSYDEIAAYAEKDKTFLRREIELCDPTIIICGYTSHPLSVILEQDFRATRNDNLFYHAEINGHDVLVLDYWHPANQYPDIMNYYSLMSIYQAGIKCLKP